MSSSIVSTNPSILFVASIFLLFSTPKIDAAPSPWRAPALALSSSVFQKACSHSTIPNSKLCIQILQSIPKIVSASNSLKLAIAIMESGISDSIQTLTYITSMLDKADLDPNFKSALQDCKSSYELVIGSLKSALGEVNSGEFETPTYDLQIASTDEIQVCQKAVASKGIKDNTIMRGNENVEIFGLSASEVVDTLSV